MEQILRTSLWERYGKKLHERIEQPRFAGAFHLSDGMDRGMRRVVGRASRGAIQICLYWLVDETDGVIADVKYQLFGPTGLIASAECASEWLLRKNYDQASRSTADLLDRHFRSPKEQAAFPEECHFFLNLVLEAIDDAVQQCEGLPFESDYDTTPIQDEELDGEGIEGWEEMDDEKKIALLEEVIDKEIRPYIELDAGGIQLLGLRDGKVVRITYQGACTSCHSSSGSTLSAIERILRSRLHRSLSVIPE